MTIILVCVSICVSDLLILYLQRRQAGLELCEAEGQLSLDLRLGGNLGHLTGSRTTTEQSGNHVHTCALCEQFLLEKVTFNFSFFT